MEVRMDGRVAAITGASTGLGLAMAKEFASSGGSVALIARKPDVLATAKAEVTKVLGKGAKVEAYSCDVSKAQPIADTFAKIVGNNQSLQQFLDGMAKGRIPLGRMGKAEEFARMACFLCSDAGSFITGVAINVDGGASPVV